MANSDVLRKLTCGHGHGGAANHAHWQGTGAGGGRGRWGGGSGGDLRGVEGGGEAVGLHHRGVVDDVGLGRRVDRLRVVRPLLGFGRDDREGWLVA